MSGNNVIAFLRAAGQDRELIDRLNVKTKAEVISAAEGLGFPFTEAEFNTLVWSLEAHLADHRGEQFDGHFPLWHTMWGKFYFEYLVADLVPSLDETGLA